MDTETFWVTIFGTSGGSLLELWTNVNGSHPLVAIVSILSTALLVAVAVVAVYTFVTALIDTMRTGKPGGEVASVWSVIRIVVSVFGLLPIFAGYSFFALTVLSVAYGASWLGNQVMRPYSEHVASGENDTSGQAYATAMGKLRATDSNRTVTALYQAALCAAGMEKTTTGTEAPVQMAVRALSPDRVVDEQTGVVKYRAEVAYGSPYGDLATDACGSIVISVSTNSAGENLVGDVIAMRRASDMYTATVNAQARVQTLVEEVMADPSVTQERIETRLNAIASEYATADMLSKRGLVEYVDTHVRSRMQYTAAQIGAAGWMLAGGWYFDLAKTYQTLHTIIGESPELKYPEMQNFSTAQSLDLSDVTRRMQDQSDTSMLTKAMIIASPYDAPTAWITKVFMGGQEIVDDWMKMFLASSGADPVRSIQNLGFIMLTVVESVYAITVVARGVAMWAKDVDFLPGVDTGFASGVAQVVMDVTSPFMTMWWTLFGFAIALAYYLPLLPAILFTIAVISWLLDVVEGVFAAGFFAVTNALPEGVGFFSSRGQSVIGALIGIVIRPPAMILALVMSVFIMDFGTRLMVAGFNLARGDAFQLYNTGLVSAIALFCIFVIIMLILARKVFGMIVTIPEAVAQWVGGQFAGRGDEQSVDQVESRFGFAGAVQSMFGRGGQRQPRNRPKGGRGPAPA